MTKQDDSPLDPADELGRAKRRIAELEAELAAANARRNDTRWVLDALDKAGIGAWEWDIPRDVVTWTDGVLVVYGIDRATFTGDYAGVLRHVHPEDRPMLKERVDRVFRVADPGYDIEHRIVTAKGETRWVRAHGFSYRDESGKPYRLAGLVLDITEQRREQAEKEAIQQQIIDAQRESLRQLGAPIIPLATNALAMPLVGTLTPERATLVTETLLHAVTERAAEHVILDVTGVPAVDHEVADGLLRVAQAVRLLGAEVALTGMQPAVAQALVELGVDMSAFVTRADLQSGIAWASRRARR
ncbi:PAS domain-containing protein [Polyangium spumosum]|uniref:PAS domain-containing protein n=1 Tax=Polyangium spumosum TaxID=889282 RepID=A0A6N7PNZ2_9BACT|nr:PAS domain-containing protein [Polyangium spumosum]MRG92516.1 PAS domain-containing protein [Polyangium spumosum]